MRRPVSVLKFRQFAKHRKERHGLRAGLKAVGAEHRSQVPPGGEGADSRDVTGYRLAHTHYALAAVAEGQDEVDGRLGSAQKVEAVGSERVESPHPPRLLAASSRCVAASFEGRKGEVREATRAAKVVGYTSRATV